MKQKNRRPAGKGAALPPWEELAAQLSPSEFSLAPEIRARYAGDRWFARALPDAVARPRSAAAVSRILAFAHRHRVPVTPRGGGHGYVGGCVPARGGLALCLERMNRIKQIHPGDFVAVAQPGVRTAKLQEEVEKQGLFYPPDPASREDSTIGGNIATNAGGPRCLKYGVTRDYVLGLEVVLADGSRVRLGSRTHKNKTGFDLGRLFVGSEGMLGVITEATLKLLPKPPFRAVLAAGYQTAPAAAQAIQAIFAAGLLPAAVEVADDFTLAAARKRTGSRQLEGADAMIIVELDGQEKSVRGELRLLEAAVRNPERLFVRKGFGDAECERLWQTRREFSYALRDTGLKKLNEDIAIPRSRLVDLFRLAADLRRRYRIPVACFGHAGDGNIHTNVMIDETDPKQAEASRRLLDELFDRILRWGGVITGEH
ncbi:MAG: FAD-binding protein, partial [Verrucomicrobia bacterium]|nr:FAD-binding protein [Verrucomicrobiota bacterium]